MKNSVKLLLAVVLVALIGAVVATNGKLLKGTFGIEEEMAALEMEQSAILEQYESYLTQALEGFDPDAEDFEQMVEEARMQADEMFGPSLDDINRRMADLLAGYEEEIPVSGNTGPEWHKSKGYEGPIGEHECKELKMLLDDGSLSVRLQNDLSAPIKCAQRFPSIWQSPQFLTVTAERCDQIDGWVAIGKVSDNLKDMREWVLCRQQFPNIMTSKEPAQTATPYPVTRARCDAISKWIIAGSNSKTLTTSVQEIDACKNKYPNMPWYPPTAHVKGVYTPGLTYVAPGKKGVEVVRFGIDVDRPMELHMLHVNANAVDTIADHKADEGDLLNSHNGYGNVFNIRVFEVTSGGLIPVAKGKDLTSINARSSSQDDVSQTLTFFSGKKPLATLQAGVHTFVVHADVETFAPIGEQYSFEVAPLSTTASLKDVKTGKYVNNVTTQSNYTGFGVYGGIKGNAIRVK